MDGLNPAGVLFDPRMNAVENVTRLASLLISRVLRSRALFAPALALALLTAPGCGTSQVSSTVTRDQLAAEVRRFGNGSADWYWSYHGTHGGYHYFSRSQPSELSLSRTRVYRLPADQLPLDSRTMVRLSAAPGEVAPLSGQPCFERRRLVNDRLVVDYNIDHGVARR
jgi:hypothetical protein